MNISNSSPVNSETARLKLVELRSILVMKTALVANAVFLISAFYHLYHGNYGCSVLFFGLAELSGEAAVTAQNYWQDHDINFEKAAEWTFILKRIFQHS